MHNLVTPRPYNWSHNPYVGEFYIRAMAYWMNHEICKDEAMKAYQDAKKYSEPWIREES
jgi:hypothetical protein